MKQAIEYEFQYNRSSKNSDTSRKQYEKQDTSFKVDSVYTITNGKEFKIDVSSEKLDKKCLDIFRNPSLFTKEPDTYSDFITKLSIIDKNNKFINFVDYVSKLS